jgi:hypothetical protein
MYYEKASIGGQADYRKEGLLYKENKQKKY